jgi:translation elongation factor EF-Tu-like GTPase
MEKRADFVAELNYLTTEQGGRRTPAYSGYWPQVKFAFSEMQTGGQQIFLDKEIVNPGESVKAEISLLSSEFLKNSLKTGLVFEFREGSKIMGTGKILEILNKELLAI